MSDHGPSYDSPGEMPEKGEFTSKEEFLAVYPEYEDLADIYFDEGDDGVTPPA